MELANHLLNSHSFIFKNNLFYQKNFILPGSFEDNYIKLREKENRMYDDDVIKKLPYVENDHPFKGEWQMRQKSLQKLIGYLTKKKLSNGILEIGCGNGWLAHQLAISLNTQVCALDVNETELLQGANTFSTCKNLFFVRADIFSSIFKELKFDCIVLAGTVQYFSDINLLITTLLELLNPSGEIHILDSPIYKGDQIPLARKRTEEHFMNLKCEDMLAHYKHHDWTAFQNFNYEVLYNPTAPLSRLKKAFTKNSPFPWIRITK